VAEQPKACPAGFRHLNTGIAGSNPRSGHECLSPSFCATLPCVGTGFATYRTHVHGVLPGLTLNQKTSQDLINERIRHQSKVQSTSVQSSQGLFWLIINHFRVRNEISRPGTPNIIQKFPELPPGARNVNGTSLC
jgi:hypothetical protein